MRMVNREQLNDAASVLTWLADETERPKQFYPQLTDPFDLEHRRWADLIARLREQSMRAAMVGFGVHRPADGDEFGLRRHGRAVARLTRSADPDEQTRAIAGFRRAALAALGEPVTAFYALPAPERVRRRLRSIGIGMDTTSRRHSYLIRRHHWALSEQVDLAALDAVLGHHDPWDLQLAFQKVLRWRVEPGARAYGSDSPELTVTLAAAMRIAPAHQLLRWYVRRNPDDLPGFGWGETAVTRFNEPCGRDLAIVWTVADKARAVAYDLTFAHPVPFTPALVDSFDRHLRERFPERWTGPAPVAYEYPRVPVVAATRVVTPRVTAARAETTRATTSGPGGPGGFAGLLGRLRRGRRREPA